MKDGILREHVAIRPDKRASRRGRSTSALNERIIINALADLKFGIVFLTAMSAFDCKWICTPQHFATRVEQISLKIAFWTYHRQP